MQDKLLDYLACPLCHSALTLLNASPQPQPDATTPARIEAGALVCSGCGHPFVIEEGIPNMLSPLLPRYEEKMREARGWVTLAKDRGWYEPNSEIDLALPDVVGKLGWDPMQASGWVATKYSFDEMMRRYARPGMRVLEVGAARTWAGAYFARMGCSYVACDIVNDAQIGLGRSRFFIEHSAHYEVVTADAEYLPFRAETFDLVFAIAALHHALDLKRMLAEMARVCRRGGVVAGLNEGVRSFFASPDADTQEEEKSYGINEHVYTLLDYGAAFHEGGLQIRHLDRGIGFETLISEQLQESVRKLQAIPIAGAWLAPLLVLGFAHPYDGVTLFATKR